VANTSLLLAYFVQFGLSEAVTIKFSSILIYSFTRQRIYTYNEMFLIEIFIGTPHLVIFALSAK
jgi:hypothetical protein